MDHENAGFKLGKKYSSHQSNGLWNSKQKDVKKN